MRDVNRIAPAIEQIRAHWLTQPRTSLAQLIVDAAERCGFPAQRYFYLEDEPLIAHLSWGTGVSTAQEVQHISEVLAAVRALWVDCPDLRLAQLLSNAAATSGYGEGRPVSDTVLVASLRPAGDRQ